MAVEIAPGLWRLDIPLVGNPLKNLNSYLITGERNLLIDTGFNQSACREAMDAQLHEIGAKLEQTDIFLTHLHSDHSGLSTYLHRKGCAVFLSDSDATRREEYSREETWRDKYASYVENGFSREEINWLWDSNPAKMEGPEPLPDGFNRLTDGQELHYGGRHLRCILTPGHTPGHLCLYDGEHKTLFSGDHVLFHISPNICRWEGIPDSLGDYLDSLDKVKNLPVKCLLPAHREETGELRHRANELKMHHGLRIKNALSIVQMEPGLTAYEITGRMQWSIRCRNWADFPLTQKFFAVGEAMAHLDYLETRGQIRAEAVNGKICYWAVKDYEGENEDGTKGHFIQMRPHAVGADCHMG